MSERGCNVSTSRVKVGTPVDRPLHPPDLLGCHVRKRAFELSGSALCRGEGRNGRRRFEIHERDPGRPLGNDEIGRADISVNDAPLVQLCEQASHGQRELEKASHRERALVEHIGEVESAEVLQHQRGLAVDRIESEDVRDSGYVEIAEQLMLVSQPVSGTQLGAIRLHELDDDGAAILCARTHDAEASARMNGLQVRESRTRHTTLYK